MNGCFKIFQDVTDPRINRRKLHELQPIIAMTLIAVIAGAQTWNEIEAYSLIWQDWLKKILDLKNGIPSHDTFNRVFALLNPNELEHCFIQWMKSFTKLTKQEVIAIDGKTIRGAAKRGNKSFVHMVSAWAGNIKMVLGQIKVNDKSNEITAIPQLIDLLVIKGCIVTVDAMGCQTKIADKIIDKGADYLIAVKGNQGTLENDIISSFSDFPIEHTATMTDSDHGRIETRNCSLITDLWMIDQEKWKGLKTLVRIDAERVLKTTGEVQRETRHYISSLNPDPVQINNVARTHWGIENILHWCLDVGFYEDASQKSTGFAARNFSIILRVALNLFRFDNTSKMGIRSKRKLAGWNPDYLFQILKQPALAQ